MNAPFIQEPRDMVGGNDPPHDPFGAVQAHVEDLLTEFRNWCDDAPLLDQAQADALSKLLDDGRKAEKATEEQRKIEAKVFDDGKAEVQARYKPLQSKLELAISAAKSKLGAWLAKVEAEKRAVAEAARAAAEEARRAASIAAQMAEADDLEARERAESLITDAKAAEKAAGRAEKDKAAATGGARAVTLRSFWTAEITDPKLAIAHYYRTNPASFTDHLHKLAMDDVRAGKRSGIPGITITEERRAV